MAKPKITTERIHALLAKEGVDLTFEGMCLVGIRGYFRDSMGQPNRNDLGIWDDGFVWIGRDGEFATFNGNTDPSRYYRNVATLKVGKWRYKTGIHPISRPGGYPAFRQAAKVIVQRWQGGSFTEDIGDFGINIHRGGANTTSSAGCQTLPPTQWGAFKPYGYDLIERYKKKAFLYLLVENHGDLA